MPAIIVSCFGHRLSISRPYPLRNISLKTDKHNSSGVRSQRLAGLQPQIVSSVGSRILKMALPPGSSPHQENGLETSATSPKSSPLSEILPEIDTQTSAKPEDIDAKPALGEEDSKGYSCWLMKAEPGQWRPYSPLLRPPITLSLTYATCYTEQTRG